MDKTYDLSRFHKAQEGDYRQALSEIKAGRKRSHWIWYIFPQLKGLGSSHMAEYYGIDGLDEAKRSYCLYQHRLIQCWNTEVDIY